MRRCLWILIWSLGVSAYPVSEEQGQRFAATSPDGTIVELLGLRSYSAMELDRTKGHALPWWRPDGSPLTDPPDNRLDRSSWDHSFLFVIRVTADTSYGCQAVGPWSTDLTVQSMTRKAPGFEKDDLRRFTLQFSSSQKQADIQLGIATGDWKTVQRWAFSRSATPYDHFFVSSEEVIMRCPEQAGPDVVAEVTQMITDRATRLVLFDRDGNQYESQGEDGGKSAGLVRYIHRFKNMNRDDIDHIEFQARSYDYWITFSNVSLRLGHKTGVTTKVTQPGSLLPGDALPNFDDIKIDFTTADAEGRMLLVCFWDVNQRPSRYLVRELARRTGEVRGENVAVVCVQACNVDQKTLQEWLREHHIAFPVGIIEADAEVTISTWGVKSLPWLILTDRRHHIVVTGFGLSELDQKIGEAKNDER